ncbi:MAG: WD40/YVTN/BNR-like repeat-containing protein [Dehalococcoidia bacterium]
MNHRSVRIALSGLLLALLVGGGFYARSALSGSGVPPMAAPTGPATGLAVAGNGSLLRTGGGLLRSDDEGRSWTPLSLPDELHPEKIREVATSPEVPSSVYAAGPGAGILRSDDDGKTWRSVSDGLPNQDVASFAVHSFRPDTLYAWIEGKGMFRTEDGGGNWEKMDEGPPADIAALAHSTLEGSMNTGWLYAATPDGPYLSMDCF